LNKSEKNQFLKNVLTIFSGTTIAQIINFSAIIILQRYFYSPEEYAPFRLFFEFAAVFSSVAALRLESGLILEREDSRALSLLRICLKYAVIVSLIGGVVFTFYFINEIKVFQYEWLLIVLMPLAIFSNGIIQISRQFFTRSKNFLTITTSRVIHSTSGSLAQIITGLLSFNFTGLVIGRLIGLVSGNINYVRKYFQNYNWIKKNKPLEKELIQKHNKFIWFSSPGVFVGNSINLITLIFFTHYYGEKFSGLLAAAIQYLGLLIMMFSSSFAQVYYNEIAQIKNPKALYKSYTYWLKRLFVLTLIGWIILVITPSSLLTSILGDKWSGLMDAIKVISPWMAIMFIASSLSYVFIRLEKQKEIFFFDVFHLVLIIITLGLGHFFLNEKNQILYLVTIVQSVFYILSISLALKFLIANLKNNNA
jgi:O-antigen/teichoic acid export membrane protein